MDLREYQFACKTFAVYDKAVELQYLSLGLISEVMELHRIASVRVPFSVRALRTLSSAFLDKESQMRLTAALNETFVDYANRHTLDEIGDVMWFAAQFCSYHRVHLEKVSEKSMSRFYSSLPAFVDDFSKLTAKYLRGDFEVSVFEKQSLEMVGVLVNTLRAKLHDKNVWLEHVCERNIDKLIERRKKRIIRNASLTDNTIQLGGCSINQEN